ncbi:glycosyltransferase family 39 protein [Candidatus Microgenomates bacterium]|nr:glycosyltransferase family 39 protein [Candidatus Microgenomates bacterium]
MKKLLIVAIFVLGLTLRLISLSNHPEGFTPDEASFGYDAYSLLTTGHDQWGKPWPLTFKSFGDYKLPLYTYLVLPSVKIFGLNEFAVRLPNALIGSFAVIATYLLVLEWFKDKKLALASAFLIAISPWHIPMSRGAFEANITTFLMPLGIFLFLKGKKNKVFYIFSALAFGLNIFSYHSARIITPFIVLYLLTSNFKSIKNSIKEHLLFILPFAVICLIALFTMFLGGASRVATSAIFSPTGGWGGILESRYLAVLYGVPDIIARMFNNKIVYLARTFISNYISYFSPQFLFSQGPSEGTYGMIPGMGVMYLMEIVFLISFLIGVVKKDIKNIGLFIFWILIAPIPAAMTKGSGFAANRAEVMIPALQIISAIGFLYLVKKVDSKVTRIVFAFLFVLSILFFIETYFVKQPIYQSDSMLFGTKQVFGYIKDNPGKKVIISRKLSEPQIYTAFYTKVDPTIYQKASINWQFEKQGLAWVDQMGEYKLDNFTFKSINNDDLLNENVIIVGQPAEFDSSLEATKTVYFPNGKPAYLIFVK